MNIAVVSFFQEGKKQVRKPNILYQVITKANAKVLSDIDPAFVRFLSSRALEISETEFAVIAVARSRIVSIFRFETGDYGFNGDVLLSACGTFTLPEYRKQGIAHNLWRIAISKVRPDVVDVVGTSRAGRRLIDDLREEFSNIKWLVSKNEIVVERLSA